VTDPSRALRGAPDPAVAVRIIGGVEIRDATAQDWPAIWPFLHQIVSAGETYAYDPDMTEDQARRLWMVGPRGRTIVAVDGSSTPSSRPTSAP
jgi:hypothetical protein